MAEAVVECRWCNCLVMGNVVRLGKRQVRGEAAAEVKVGIQLCLMGVGGKVTVVTRGE